MPVIERKAPLRLALVPRAQLQASSPTNAATATDVRKQHQRDPQSTSERRRVRAAVRARIERQRTAERHKSLSDELAEEAADTADVSDSKSASKRAYTVAARGIVDNDDHVNQNAVDDQMQDQHQLRLGERFLRMMTTMARLSRVSLGNHHECDATAAAAVSSSNASALTALEQIVHKTESLQRQSPLKSSLAANASSPKKSPVKGAAVPVLVPVNVATEPLRPLLTFEISMLLPPPIDTRQSALQSPIRRKPLRPKRRRRKKKRVRREPRVYETSHVTWAPRTSAAYIDAHNARRDHAALSLAAQFALLQRDARPLKTSTSLPVLPNRPSFHAYSTDATRSPVHSLCRNDAVANTIDATADVDDEKDSESDDHDDVSDRDDSTDASGSESVDESDDDDAAAKTIATATTSTTQDDRHDNDVDNTDNNEPPFGSFSYLQTSSSNDITAAASTLGPHEAPPSASSQLDPAAPAAADDTTATSTQPTWPLHHQPAWISPELALWLVASGMFATRRRRRHHHSSSH